MAPQGRMRGRLPLPPIPRVTTRGDSRCRQHPRRGQDPSLRTEPLTGVRVTPRAGHARPLPCGGPGTGARANPAGVSISPSVGRGAPTPPRPPAVAHSRANRRGQRPRRPVKPPANTLGGITTLAFPLGGSPGCQKIAFLPYCVCRGDHWSPANLPQQRIFRDSFLQGKRARASNARPYKSFSTV